MHRRQKNSTLYCERIEKRKGGWRGTQERLGAWECVSIKSVDFLLGHDEQATKSNIKHGNDSRSGCRGLSRMLLLGAFSIIDLPRLVWPTRWTVTRKASWAWFMNIFLILVHVLSTITRKSMMFCVDLISDGPEDQIDPTYEITVKISKTRWYVTRSIIYSHTRHFIYFIFVKTLCNSFHPTNFYHCFDRLNDVHYLKFLSISYYNKIFENYDKEIAINRYLDFWFYNY